MTKKKFDEKAHYKKLEDEHKTIKSYLSKIKDRNYEAIKLANESIKYKFDELDYEDTQEKYSNTIYNHIVKKIKEETNVKDSDGIALETLVKNLGGITAKEIKEMVKSKGSKLDHNDITQLLGKSEDSFSQQHYAALTNKYITNDDEKKVAMKYLGISADEYDFNVINEQHLPSMFYYHATQGQVPKGVIPPKARKLKAKKRAPKKK